MQRGESVLSADRLSLLFLPVHTGNLTSYHQWEGRLGKVRAPLEHLMGFERTSLQSRVACHSTNYTTVPFVLQNQCQQHPVSFSAIYIICEIELCYQPFLLSFTGLCQNPMEQGCRGLRNEQHKHTTNNTTLLGCFLRAPPPATSCESQNNCMCFRM